MCDRCKGCIHRRALSGKSAAVCQYAIDTGKLRGCDPEDCPHWSGDQKELKKCTTNNKAHHRDKIGN